MTNKLTINGVTIEYPSQMSVTISGTTVRLKLEDVPPTTPEPVPPSSPLISPVTRVMPTHTTPKMTAKPTRMAAKPASKPLYSGVLPPDWKDIVIATLRQNGGSAYARRLSMRVFKGVTKLSYAQATHLRRELRAMVDRGELLALGSNKSQAPQMLYGLPSDTESTRMQAAPES